MENKAHALIAGLFTLALLAAVVAIAMWLNRDKVERIPYQLATKLSVPGLNPQAAVRYRGLDVGRVDSIEFDPQEPGQILINIRVDLDTPITHSTYGTLGYQGVTGIAYIQLDDDGSNLQRLPSSAGQVARITLRPSLFDNLQNKGMAILIQIEEMAKRLNNLAAEENQKTVVAAFESVNQAATALEAIPRQLQPTLEQLPALTRQTQELLESVTRLSQNANSAMAALQDPSGPLGQVGGTVKQIAAAASDVSAAAQRLEQELLPLTSEARITLRTMSRTMEGFGSRPQSILFGLPTLPPGPGENGFAAPPSQ